MILVEVILVQEGAVCLLCTITTIFPSSIHRHYDSVSYLMLHFLIEKKKGPSVIDEQHPYGKLLIMFCPVRLHAIKY